MKEKGNAKRGFIIYDFMVKELELCPQELLIYAVIYSFTRFGDGCFCGSQQYLSERLGLGLRTVSRHLTALVKRGLIVKRKNGSFTEYAAVRPGAEDCRTGAPDWRRTAPDWHSRDADLADNNKEDNKAINTTTTTTQKASPSEGRGDEGEKDSLCRSDMWEREYRERFITFGRAGVVRMTTRQYDDLLDRLGADTLDDYIARAEAFVLHTTERGTYIHSAYKTILDWVAEDIGLA